MLRFTKLSEDASTPVRASIESAGYDLFSAIDVTIPGYGKALINTDIKIQVPYGTYGRIAPRSGLACHHHIGIGGGVIDGDYRGNVKIILFNHSSDSFTVNKGDRIAQLICEKIIYPELEEVPFLECTERNDKGFGSSGGKLYKGCNV